MAMLTVRVECNTDVAVAVAKKPSPDQLGFFVFGLLALDRSLYLYWCCAVMIKIACKTL